MTFIVDSIVFLGSGALFYSTHGLQVRKETTIVVNLPYPGEVDFETKGLRILDWKRDTFHYAVLDGYRKLEKEKGSIQSRMDSLSRVLESYKLNLRQMEATVKQIENGKISLTPSLLSSVRGMYLKTSLKVLSLQKKLDRLQEKLKSVENSMARYRRLKGFGSLLMRVRPIKGTSQTVSTLVFSRRPSYHPIYEFYLRSSDFTGNLNIRALVNLSGDNPIVSYRTDRIVFSSRPGIFRVSRPKPSPWYIDILEPMPLRKYMAPSKGAERGLEMVESEIVQPAEVRKTFVGMEFVASGKYVLHYQGKNYIDLKDYPAKLKPHYYAYPRLSSRAYIIAEFNNRMVDMAPGRAVFYIDGRKVGETSTSYIPMGDTDTLTVGYDPSIHVERKLIEKNLNKKGLFGKKRILEKRKYRTVIKNFKDSPIDLLAYFNKPVPRSADVKVEKYGLDVPHKELDNGIIEVRIHIPAGGSAVITESIEVSYPSGLRIIW